MAYAINALVTAMGGLRRREEGQGFVEYVVLIALIALALFAAIIFFRTELGKVFSAITSIVQNELPPD